MGWRVAEFEGMMNGRKEGKKKGDEWMDAF